MMGVPYVLLGLILVCATLFFRVAGADGRSGWLWATFSVGAGVFAHTALRWGLVGFLCAQGALFCAMWFANSPTVRNE